MSFFFKIFFFSPSKQILHRKLVRELWNIARRSKGKIF